MTTSGAKTEIPGATSLTVAGDVLAAELADGRAISVPLAWYPRLAHATPQERENVEIFGDGRFLHWPDLDEDLTTEMLVLGVKSGENEGSFKRWLDARRSGRPAAVHEIPAS